MINIDGTYRKGALVLGAALIAATAFYANAAAPWQSDHAATGSAARDDHGAGEAVGETMESVTITQDGTVLDGAVVNGSISIQADNVTIKDTTVRYSGYHSIRVFPGAEGTEVLRTTIECGSERTNGLVFGNYVAEEVRANGCRNAFLSDAANPAEVVASWVDGEPFEQPAAPDSPPVVAAEEPSATATPTPTPGVSATPSSAASETPAPGPTNEAPAPTVSPPTAPLARPTVRRTWPTPGNTGPRRAAKRTTNDLSSRKPGQVISRVTVNGRLTIRHDDVTVRDVTINGDTTYMLHVEEKADGTCPRNVRVKYTEIDGSDAAEDDIPIYLECGAVFDRGHVHHVGRTSRLTDNGTVKNSYVISNRTGDSGAHRGAVGTNGGSNNKIINNVLICEGSGCSAAIPMYGDFAPVKNMLVKRNLMATTGSYCAYGGSVSSKDYPDGSRVRFIDNHFSTRFFKTCGRYGTVASFDNGVRGNVWSGNVWHESGKPVRAPR
ncbi:hypothetical protein [Nocardioides seonyuensis]|uniref:hypothetical protein n=1 Tax=Nocardioides seonyuensis TaxID=2518371 RepID=UPI00141FE8F5|nr:hypothetical protein [Nocardioides seonyuensis]